MSGPEYSHRVTERGKYTIDPEELLGRIGADAAEARRVASEAAAKARATSSDLSQLRARDAVLDTRLTAVETQVRQLPQLVASELQCAIDKAIGGALRQHFFKTAGVLVGALGIGGGGVYLRMHQSDTVNLQRISATREADEATQKRLFEQALAEGIARRDRELEAARVEELRRQVAAERASTMRQVH